MGEIRPHHKEYPWNADLRRATQADGCRPNPRRHNIRYTLHGETAVHHAAPALVHSVAMDRQFWRPVSGAAGEAAVLTCDCRGHGESDKPEGPYTVELFAEDIEEFMTHVGWHLATVAGASMGG